MLSPSRPVPSPEQSRRPGSGNGKNPVSEAFRPLRSVFLWVGLVSFLINLLMLTGPLFMLQVYDRVLASGSVPTLVVIGALAILLYVFFGLLDGMRNRILARLAQRFDARLSTIAYRLSSSLPIRLGRQAARVRPVQDLDTVRQFLSGPGPAAMFDMPWLPFYLGIVFLFHPALGLVALSGAIIISILIGVNEAMSRSPVAEANRQTSLRASDVEISQRNSEVMHAMGMDDVLAARWAGRNDDYLTAQRRMADRSGFFGTLIKTIRFVLQSAMLGTGAWLAIKQEITPGVMIASSIMTSRALSPIEQAVAQWRGFVACRQALRRLREGLANATAVQPETELPLPAETLSVEGVHCGPYGSTTPFVRGASFELQAGDGLGIIGPSGSGKSTLARALVGVLPTLGGKIRYDGADISQWASIRRGEFIGYLPQDLQLFDGTVAENIARFRTEASSQQVIEAARLADVHDLIVSLPEGYDTLIGRSGYALSAGQSQRIALARALYGNPFVVVLDEPNSNLDAEGEAALTGAIKSAQQRGAIVIVIAHRPSALATLNKILCLRQGQTVAFGPKDEVLKKIVAPVPMVGGGAQ